MSISAVDGVLASVEPGYDFTKMTNEQFLDATQTLFSEGKISKQDSIQLSSIAQGVDSVPINGPSPSVQSILADASEHNFIQEVGGDLNSASKPGAVGAALYEAMLNDLISNNKDDKVSVTA